MNQVEGNPNKWDFVNIYAEHRQRDYAKMGNCDHPPSYEDSLSSLENSSELRRI
jgi:hypothetical protein